MRFRCEKVNQSLLVPEFRDKPVGAIDVSERGVSLSALGIGELEFGFLLLTLAFRPAGLLGR